MPSPTLTGKARLPIRHMLLLGFWPSPVKRLIYRLKGYRIGRGVSFGFGSVLLGDDVEVGDETEIGFLTVVRGKTIRLGAHVQIGSMTIIDAPLVEIGEGTKINEQVFVGGLQFPDSKFIVGRNCQIMQMTFINPTRSIVIGDDSGIGGDCLLFGHTTCFRIRIDERCHTRGAARRLWRAARIEIPVPGKPLRSGVVLRQTILKRSGTRREVLRASIKRLFQQTCSAIDPPIELLLQGHHLGQDGRLRLIFLLEHTIEGPR